MDITATFDELVAQLNTAPACTIRFNSAPCRHRAKWYIRKRECCHESGVDFLCDTCQLRLHWLMTLGVRFECAGCGTRSATFEAMFPLVDAL